MCGIAGIVSLDDSVRVDPQSAQKMAETLVHRGPDEAGLYVDPDRQLALAFRRLAIIDLPTGRQPLANEDGCIHAICNGEIYNFKKLRENLLAAGHQFTSAGDIEPIVHLYENHGMKFLDRIDGFFALALADLRRRKIILAVDRAGKKPLYYTSIDNQLYFASELKAIRKICSTSKIDKAALIDYFRFGYVPAPETIFSGIFKLPPGHCLQLDLNYHRQLKNKTLPVATRYYHPHTVSFDSDYHAAKSKLTCLLRDAVTKRLVADVPLGILLSGGIDSSIVTALAAQNSSSPVKTFSVGFKSRLYNELPLANLVARRYKTDHTELMVEPDVESMLDMVAAIYDEPFADSSAIPTSLICRQASVHVRVVLTGDGGDEAFCGYDRYRALAITSFLSKLGARPFGKLIERFIPRPGAELRSRKTRFWRLVRALRFSPARQYSMLLQVFFDRQLENLLGPELKPELTSRIDFIAQLVDGCTDSLSMIEKANRCDLDAYLPGDLLVKIDRASMASSLEARSPFLDTKLLEFAHSLPLRYRCSIRQGKRILRDTFCHLLPPELLAAPKRGFGVPMGDWLRGPLQPQMRQILGPGCRIVKTGLVDNVYLVRLLAEHLNGMYDHSARIWSLMILEKFLHQGAP